MAAKPFTVRRRVIVQAPAGEVRSHIVDFHEWQAWSPWEEIDPGMRRHYSGARSGVGAEYAWEGDRKAGKGQMTITEVETDLIHIHLRFEKPFPSENRVEFALTPHGADATAVEWRMHGEVSGFMQLFTMIKSMDSLIGPDFEKGLARLQGICEAEDS